MWDEIQDMPGEIFDIDQWIDEIAADPEFIDQWAMIIAQSEASNAQFDLEVAQLP